jgi:hypothetical protein
MTAKILREISRRQFTHQETADIFILATAMLFFQIAHGRQEVQFIGVDKFADEVKNLLRTFNLEAGIPN